MNWRRGGYGGNGRQFNSRTGNYEDRPSFYQQRDREREREAARRALIPVNKNAADKPGRKHADPKAPPYGQRVALEHKFSGLPVGLMGTVPEQSLFERVHDGNNCPVYFRKELYHCPWSNLLL